MKPPLRDPARESKTPGLSVIVAAYNAAKTIEACLQSIRKSTWTEYELIVVDDGSQDDTPLLAKEYADVLVQNPKNRGRFQARQTGIRRAKSSLVVNIDSDVVIYPDTLKRIFDFFSAHPEADALTGLLAKEHPYSNYFSQYKNLYMHYRFRGLPERVTFLYGSLFAMKRQLAVPFRPDVEIADDTAWGQELRRQGCRIFFSSELAVIHLKKYSFPSWLENDFRIPYDWARIFWRYRGWRQLGKNQTGFAHASLSQIVSLFLVPASILLLSVFKRVSPLALPLGLTLGLLWLLLNAHFLNFLAKEKGFLFAVAALPITLLDHLIMGAGVFAGFWSSWIHGRPPSQKRMD